MEINCILLKDVICSSIITDILEVNMEADPRADETGREKLIFFGVQSLAQPATDPPNLLPHQPQLIPGQIQGYTERLTNRCSLSLLLYPQSLCISSSSAPSSLSILLLPDTKRHPHLWSAPAEHMNHAGLYLMPPNCFFCYVKLFCMDS